MAELKTVDVPKDTDFSELPKSDGLDARLDANEKRLASTERLTRYILYVAIIGLIGVVVAGIGLVLDQMRFNNQTYRQTNSEHIQLLQDEINNLKAGR